MDSLVQPSNGVRYLILESDSPESLLQQLYEIEPNPEWEYLFAHTDWAAYWQESPILLKAYEDSALRRWALQGFESERWVGLVIESDQSFQMVADWARLKLSVQLEGGGKGLLRFYDPLVWHRLAPSAQGDGSATTRVSYWHGEPGEGRWLTVNQPDIGIRNDKDV